MDWASRTYTRRAPIKKRHAKARTRARGRRLTFEPLEGRALLSSTGTSVDLRSPGAPTQNERFVGSVYLDFLDRTVDPAGLAYFEGLLAAGLSRQQVVLLIEQTPEFASREVEQLYEQYLHREADSGALTYYSNLLLGGATIEQISADLADSSEFFVSQGDGTNEGFLNAAYEDALGRPIDPAGLAWWTQVLAGGASRTQVVDEILITQEYRQDTVEHAYLQLLFRQADPAALQYWVGVLNSGASDQMVYAGIAGSDEYVNKPALGSPLTQWKDLGNRCHRTKRQRLLPQRRLRRRRLRRRKRSLPHVVHQRRRRRLRDDFRQRDNLERANRLGRPQQ